LRRAAVHLNLKNCAILSPIGGFRTRVVIATKYIRATMVVIALLLASTANLVDFSYDADHDETTPPVVVNLQFVLRAQRSVPRAVTVAQIAVRLNFFVQSSPLPALRAETALVPIERPPQHLLPLLC
jgi:hypothetical protein